MTAELLISTISGPRPYTLLTPTGEVRAAALFLPGTGGTAGWAALDTGFPTAAARHGVAVAIGTGLPPNPAKPSKFLTNPPRWNDGGTTPGDPLHSAADDTDYLAALVADLTERGLVPTGRVGVVGFSNGAGMAFRFAVERADLVHAILPVAGYCWLPAALAHLVPTLYLVGTADPLVPLEGGPTRLPWGGPTVYRPNVRDMLSRWAVANGCDPVPIVTDSTKFTQETRYPGPVEMRAIFVTGHGHHWPGGGGLLGEKWGGPNRPGFEANRHAIEFLLRHAAR